MSGLAPEIARRHAIALPHFKFQPLSAGRPQSSTQPAAALWWTAFLVTALAIISPLFVTDIPPLLDYPNHLARIEMLAQAAGDPVLSHMYTTKWQILPNIGIDAAMPPLLAFVSLNVAGRCFIGLALLLPFIGTNLLHAALFRQRSYWPLAAALVVYNELLFAGFLNYLIGLGLALIGAALWVWTIDRPAVRIVTGAGLAIIIFFCHLIALVCYGFLLLAIEVAYAIERRPSQGFVGRLDAARIAALIFPFVLPALLYLHAPLADASVAAHWGVLPKIEGVFGGFMTYSYVLDGCAFLLAIGVILACWWTKRLSVARAALFAFVGLCILYAFAPFAAKGTGFIDQRLPPLASFVLFAGTQPIGLPRWPRALISAALISIVALRLADVSLVWRHHNEDLAAFHSVISTIEPGSRVLPVMVTPDDVPDFYRGQPPSRIFMFGIPAIMHLPSLALIERHAFSPLLFTAPTKQPLRVLPPYSKIAVGEGIVPSYKWLNADAPKSLPRDAPYLENWRDTFDYVLVLFAGKLPDAAHFRADVLTPVAITDVAALYRIKKVTSAPSGPGAAAPASSPASP